LNLEYISELFPPENNILRTIYSDEIPQIPHTFPCEYRNQGTLHLLMSLMALMLDKVGQLARLIPTPAYPVVQDIFH